MPWKELFLNATGTIHHQQYDNIFFVSVQIHGFDVIPPYFDLNLCRYWTVSTLCPVAADILCICVATGI